MIRHFTIGSIMTPKPVCIEADLKLSRAREQMESLKVRQLPVTRFGLLAGVLTRENLRTARANPFHEDLPVAEAMDVDPYVVPPSMAAEEVLWDMVHYKLDYVLVARDENKPTGIFTRQDALKLLLDPPRRKGWGLRLVKPARGKARSRNALAAA